MEVNDISLFYLQCCWRWLYKVTLLSHLACKSMHRMFCQRWWGVCDYFFSFVLISNMREKKSTVLEAKTEILKTKNINLLDGRESPFQRLWLQLLLIQIFVCLSLSLHMLSLSLSLTISCMYSLSFVRFTEGKCARENPSLVIIISFPYSCIHPYALQMELDCYMKSSDFLHSFLSIFRSFCSNFCSVLIPSRPLNCIWLCALTFSSSSWAQWVGSLANKLTAHANLSGKRFRNHKVVLLDHLLSVSIASSFSSYTERRPLSMHQSHPNCSKNFATLSPFLASILPFSYSFSYVTNT